MRYYWGACLHSKLIERCLQKGFGSFWKLPQAQKYEYLDLDNFWEFRAHIKSIIGPFWAFDVLKNLPHSTFSKF